MLRLGAHQLLGMRVPTHAAVDQTVGLAKVVAGAGASGFVNAVMRRISERSLEEWREAVVPAGGASRGARGAAQPPASGSSPRCAPPCSATAAPPPATVDAELAALLTADNEPPHVHVVARPGLTTVDELCRYDDVEPSPTSPIGIVLGSGDPGLIPEVRDGRAAVQDEGSQLVALALAAAEVPDDVPARWLDLCAGPGGKAGVLGALAVQAGADLTAVEVTPHRADLVRNTLRALTRHAKALGRHVEVRTADGRAVGEDEPAAYAKVLVDAPCTGLGALRRRPEARWRRQPSDVAELAPLQRALLASALDAVAPGGVVAYATCSPHVAETRFVVSDVLKRRRDVEVVDARPLFTDAVGPPARRVWATGRTCSSGRTCTAPTRCSSRCCGRPPEPVDGRRRPRLARPHAGRRRGARPHAPPGVGRRLLPTSCPTTGSSTGRSTTRIAKWRRILASPAPGGPRAASRSSTRRGAAVAWVVAGPPATDGRHRAGAAARALGPLRRARSTTAAGSRRALARVGRSVTRPAELWRASTATPGPRPSTGKLGFERDGVEAPHRRDRAAPASAWCEVARVSRVQISPSILSADFANLERELGAISNADWAHVDVMDNHFVPNLTLGLPVVEALVKVSPIPIDCHLMIDDPDRWAPGYAEAGAKSVTFHVEAVRGCRGHRPRDPRGGRAGGLRGQAGHRRSRRTPTCSPRSTWCSS